jgi:putative peptide zinc metalloprotease protein
MGEIPEKPKAREDLVIVKQEDGEGDYYVLKDPVSGRYFRIEEEERKVIGLLDGSRTPEDVLSAVKADLDVDLEEIEDFVRVLDDHFFLESRRPEAPSRPVAQGSSIFNFRVRLVNPERVVDVLARYLGFAVSAPALLLALSLILLAIYLTVSEPGVFREQAALMKQPLSILLLYAVASVLMTLHELGHAIACRKFKGRVREMGFLLLYFIPCFYTDVSDIYLMKSRSQRMAVILAGPLTELTLWSVFTIAYVCHPRGGALSTFFFLAMLASGAKSLLMNFNPFIKMDGYYLLEELLGVVNLMERSGARLARAASRGRPGGDAGAGDERRASSREERIFLAYAVASLLYVVLLLAASAFAAALFFRRYVGPWAYALFGTAAALLMFLHLRKLFKGRRTGRGERSGAA